MTEPTRAVTLDLWLTLISEPTGGAYSTNRRLLRADGTLAVLAEHGEFFDRSRLIDVFDVISDTINSDHELGVDMYFGDRIVQTLSMLDEGLPARLGPAGIERVWEVIDESLDESPPFLMPGALEALQELSRKPVKLGVISNTGNSSSRAYGRMFRAMGIDGYFRCGLAVERAGDGQAVPGDIPPHTRWAGGCTFTAPCTSATILRRTSPERRAWA